MKEYSELWNILFLIFTIVSDMFKNLFVLLLCKKSNYDNIIVGNCIKKWSNIWKIIYLI